MSAIVFQDELTTRIEMLKYPFFSNVAGRDRVIDLRRDSEITKC
jgi:hypothetical protein